MDIITDNTVELANRRGTAMREAFPAAVSALYDRDTARLVISLSSRAQISVHPADIKGLERALPADFEGVEISASGLGLHFPKIDADIYLPSLLEQFVGSGRAWTV